MLQKLTLPLREECVLVLQLLPKHTVFAPFRVMLLMSGHTSHFPPTTAQLWYELHLCCCWPCWTTPNTATPSHLLLLQLQHLQQKSIQNNEPFVFSMMHLSPESWLLLVSALSLKPLRCCWLCAVPTALHYCRGQRWALIRKLFESISLNCLHMFLMLLISRIKLMRRLTVLERIKVYIELFTFQIYYSHNCLPFF